MMSRVCILLLVLIFTVLFEVLASNGTSNISSNADLIHPDNGRRNFIIFHLTRGYQILNGVASNNFIENQEENDKFSVQFYINAVKCCSVKNPNNGFKPAARDVICFDDGQCIDIGDPGVHPHQ